MSLITALDLMEADYCDDEETADDEPSLGWTERGGQSYYFTAPNPCQGAIDDLELDTCDDEDGHDAEDTCPEDYGDGAEWPNDLESQEVLVSL